MRLLALALFFPVTLLASVELVFSVETAEQKMIYSSHLDGSHLKPLMSDEGYYSHPSIDATGRYVTFTRGRLDESILLILDRKTQRLEHLVFPGESVFRPVFSGDGNQIAVSVGINSPKGPRVVVIDLAATRKAGAVGCLFPVVAKADCYRPAVVHSEESPSAFGSLSTDHSLLAYLRLTNDREKKELVIHDLINQKLQVVTETKNEFALPVFSPDDRFLAFTDQTDLGVDVFVYDLHKKSKFRVTKDGQASYPTFLPDGKLLYVRIDDEDKKLYAVSQEALIAQAHFEFSPIAIFPDAIIELEASGRDEYVQAVSKPLLDTPKSSFGVIQHQNKTYVVGGHQGHEHTYPKESFSDYVQVFDPAVGEWKPLARRTIAAHGFGLAAYGKYIYAFGGFAYAEENNPKWRSLDEIERYDIERNVWEVIGKLPRRRSSNVVATVGTKVYLIAGWDATPKKPGDLDGKFHREIDVFDLLTETVSVSPQKLTGPLRRALTSVVVGDEILLVAGLGEGASHFELLDRVTAFRPSTGTWRELPPLPFPTFAPGVGVIGSRLFVFGGMFKTGPLDYVYVNHIYTLENLKSSSAWQNTGRYLSESKGFPMVVSLNPTTLGILGGHRYFAETDSPVLTFETFGF